MTSTRSATIRPSSSASRRIGVMQEPVEVAVLDVGDQGVGLADAGDGEDDRHRELERLEVEAPRRTVSANVAEGAHVHDVEEHRHDQRRDDRLGLARQPAHGPAGRPRARSARKPAVRGRIAVDAADGRRAGVVTAVLIVSPSWMRLPVSSRKTSSSVGVRSVRAAHPDAGLGQRHRHGADGGGAVGGAGQDLAARDRRPSRSTSRRLDARRGRVVVAVDLDDDEVGADACASAPRACPRPRCVPPLMMPTRSAS